MLFNTGSEIHVQEGVGAEGRLSMTLNDQSNTGRAQSSPAKGAMRTGASQCPNTPCGSMYHTFTHVTVPAVSTLLQNPVYVLSQIGSKWQRLPTGGLKATGFGFFFYHPSFLSNYF